MKIYEEPILSIYELFENDIVTSSSLAGYDDTGEWSEGWSTNAGGNVK